MQFSGQLTFGKHKIQMGQNINLRPGATILLYINVLLSPSLSHLIPHAIINLGGNIGMFIPLGLFLPAIWPGLQKLWKTLLVTALIISLVEIAQLLSLVGSCDVDDLILNVLGCAMGFGVYRLSTG